MLEWDREVIAPVEKLIDGWTRENNTTALGMLLPGWRSNSGITDGWAGALDVVRSTADLQAVAPQDQAILRQVAGRIEHALHNR